jgi:hypothetical protein
MSTSGCISFTTASLVLLEEGRLGALQTRRWGGVPHGHRQRRR